jgi:hypothetical protein
MISFSHIMSHMQGERRASSRSCESTQSEGTETCTHFYHPEPRAASRSRSQSILSG